MRVLDLAIYSDKEFTTLHEAKKKRFQPQVGEPFDVENVRVQWSIKESSAFKKGFKKYANDKRAVSSLRSLIGYIQEYTTKNDNLPPLSDYPSEFYVHPLKAWGKNKGFPSALSAHIVGQKIILIFNINSNTKDIELLHLGTHQAAGYG